MESRKQATATLTDKFVLLSTLNVLQPMTIDEIHAELSKYLKGGVEDVLNSLIESRHVTKVSQDQYVLSLKGIRAAGKSSLKKKRDIRRMLYLANRSKRGRGQDSILGDGSSPLVQEPP